mgnify:CR=1 FL=1
MGTINAMNPVHKDNGRSFRDSFERINNQYLATLPYISKDMRAAKAHDLLLAKMAVLSSSILTNDYRLASLNTTAKEYKKSSLNPVLFDKFFNMLIKEIRS